MEKKVKPVMLAVIQTENESNRQGGDTSSFTTKQRSEPPPKQFNRKLVYKRLWRYSNMNRY